MRRPPHTPISRRLGAVALSITILWVVFAAAGSDTVGGAMEALSRQGQLPIALLRQELGDIQREDLLTMATELVISQSPLLLGSREAILSLRSEDQGEDETRQETPIREEPVSPEPASPDNTAPPTFADNGVPAKTLLPTSSEGYLLRGLAYINNYSNNSLTAEEVQGDFAAVLGEGEPQVLIVHTHGSEAYTMPPGQEYVPSGESRTTDTAYNVVRIGDEIADVLSRRGISTIHDRSLYDYPQYNGAYDRSLDAIEGYLAKYPSICFVLDVHRDAISDGEGTVYKVISETAQGPSAQLSLIVGTNGSGLKHDQWRENLRLAAAVQDTILQDFPTLMRPITVRNSRYNQHCTTGSLLVEMGAAGNSLDEALLAAKLFAEGFADTILPTKSS